VHIRPGSVADLTIALRLLDGAIAWLESTGRIDQWGTEPFSSSDGRRKQIADYLADGMTRVAEMHGAPVGLSVLKPEPTAYVEPADVPELYLHLLVTDRDHVGAGVGQALVDDASELARKQGASQLRVDCFAGHDGGLVEAYRRLGFSPVGDFVVKREDLPDWPGCVLVRSA